MFKRPRISRFILGVLLFAGLGTVWLERQDIYDWWRLQSYQAPAAVAQLATDTTMNSATRRVFYINHPEVDDKASFRSHCTNGEREQTIILGCYVQKKGIYVLAVNDSRLAGIEQVTAAHELLHAAYDRLSKSERTRTSELITKAYAGVSDQRIRDTIDAYKRAGADVTNELHSILGTEVKNLPPELETYYSQYFTNRARVVSYSETYQQAFTDRKSKVAAYDLQLTDLKAQIDANQSELGQRAILLEAKRSDLDQLKSSGMVAAYNAEVSSYNADVRSYNSIVDSTKKLIAMFNDILNQRNGVALEEQELFQAIDSQSLSPESSQ